MVLHRVPEGQAHRFREHIRSEGFILIPRLAIYINKFPGYTKGDVGWINASLAETISNHALKFDRSSIGSRGSGSARRKDKSISLFYGTSMSRCEYYS
jgi:hypothetical protein